MPAVQNTVTKSNPTGSFFNVFYGCFKIFLIQAIMKNKPISMQRINVVLYGSCWERRKRTDIKLSGIIPLRYIDIGRQ